VICGAAGAAGSPPNDRQNHQYHSLDTGDPEREPRRFLLRRPEFGRIGDDARLLHAPRAAGITAGVTPPAPAAPFLTALHADKPLRVWSLIVTILGDIVMRQGADLAPRPVWTGHLLDLLTRLGVEAGLARTALSRLVSGGVLERGKAGRNTYYRLSAASAAEFAKAAERIYGREPLVPTGQLHLVLIDRVADKAAARKALEASGFRFLSSSATLRPAYRDETAPEWPARAIATVVDASGEAAAAARELWRIDDLNSAYAGFIRQFGVVHGDWPPEAAIIARVVLVHRMRRLLLRDPLLPASALPADWVGETAKALFVRHLAAFYGPSERWLSENGFRDGFSG
jgi:phenylacetic acid degradation operon negative regulatory protein